jgi:predicted DCC family thiol-disulfide oxidoreductase YuxK
MKRFIKNKLNKKVDALGLAIFRVLFSIALFCEVFQIYTFQHLTYDRIPFVDVGEITMNNIFFFWFIVIGCICLGIKTRIMTVLNYIFSIIIFSSAAHFEYHIFYTYVTIAFLFMFMPIERVFSFDSLWYKMKYSSVGSQYVPDRMILGANYYVPLFVGIGFVYLDSVLFKLTSSFWLKGLGMWLPASMPMATWNNTSWLLDHEYLVKFLGYLVIVFEIVFLILMWFKSWRIPLLVLGIFFHIGILIVYPIPWFAISMCTIYLLMVPISWWKKIGKLLHFKKPIYKFYYDAECPLCLKVVLFIKHFDIFNSISCLTVQEHSHNDLALNNLSTQTLLINIHGVSIKNKVSVGYDAYIELFKKMIYTWPVGFLMGLPGLSVIGKSVYKYVAGNRITERCTAETCLMPIIQKPLNETEDVLIAGFSKLNISQKFWKYYLVIVIIIQTIISIRSPFPQEIIKRAGLSNPTINKNFKKYYPILGGSSKRFLGLYQHPLFMDYHFSHYNPIIAITYQENGKTIWLPIIDSNGMPCNYNTGPRFANWTFSTIVANVNGELMPTFPGNIFNKNVSRYINYWVKNNRPYLFDQTLNFTVMGKTVKLPTEWEEGLLDKQCNQPWKKLGTISWSKSVAKTITADSTLIIH